MFYKFLKGFVYAFEGIVYTFKTQINFRFHLLFALLVVFSGCLFKVSIYEWLFLFLSIGLVLILELINTSIEHLTDLASQDRKHSLAKVAKDTAAGAVLLGALTSAIIGTIIFLPKFIVLVKYWVL